MFDGIRREIILPSKGQVVRYNIDQIDGQAGAGLK